MADSPAQSQILIPARLQRRGDSPTKYQTLLPIDSSKEMLRKKSRRSIIPIKTMYVYFGVETTPPHCERGKVLVLLRGVAVSTPPAVSMIQGRFERNSCHRHRQILVRKAEVEAFKTREGLKVWVTHTVLG